MQLLEIAYMLRPVDVAVIRTYKSIPIIEENLVRGTEIKVPFWLAKVLEEEGIVEIREPAQKESDVRKVKFLQMQQRNLPIKIDEFFYIKISRWLRDLERHGKNQADVGVLTLAEKVRRDLHDLYRMRLNKLVMAIMLGHTHSIERNLSNEERLIVSILGRSIREWTKHLGVEV